MSRFAFGIFIALASAGVVIPRYFALGFSHILPDGPDHLLFILGLFFLSRNFSILLFQLTLFTLAHSLTLGLSLYGLVSLPMSWVEVAIALSISFIAIENLFAKDKLRAWRPWIVFVFGLIHGLGFGHSFAETPIAKEDFLVALFSFNLGIEIAQLVVVGIAYAAVSLWWKRDFYYRLIARPCCFMIASIGLYMAVERAV